MRAVLPIVAPGHRSDPWPVSAAGSADGDLSVAGVGLAGLAAEFGTALNILDTGEFRSRCTAYLAAFPGATVAYAGKALLTRAIVGLIDDLGLGLDVCSSGELSLASACGFPADRLILHGNAKSRALLEQAVSASVGRIVLDSWTRSLRWHWPWDHIAGNAC